MGEQSRASEAGSGEKAPQDPGRERRTQAQVGLMKAGQ